MDNGHQNLMVHSVKDRKIKGTISVVFSRMLKTNDPLDYQINFDAPGIEWIHGVNNNPGFGLAGHGSNNGVTFVPWKDHSC